MTIRDLKTKLNTMDDNSMIMMQSTDGTQMEITNATQEGDNLTLWAK